MEKNSERLEVYSAIADITGELGKTGIAKDSQNMAQKYKFRGIDAVFQALSPLLSKHRLLILPRVVAHDQTEYKTQSGGRMVNTVLDVEFDFVSAKDGSTHTVRTVGEAMDSADKSSNKAMSAAYKYAAFLTFCVPVEGEEDADASSPSVLPYQAPEKAQEAKNASPEERKRNAGLFLSRNLDIKVTPTTPQFQELKAIAGADWVEYVLEYEQKAIEPYKWDGLLTFVKAFESAPLEGSDLNEKVQEVFK